ncbi:hypothetical protein [Krasilnikovia sp. MM14-A1004]|uniref:hypothetical protein n=1 Tax=Krasilnikovia sp. MM14-A1004 TaxID=3373541 RepID=UPI00399CB91F
MADRVSAARSVPGGRVWAGVCAVLLLLLTTGSFCDRSKPATDQNAIAGLQALSPPPAGSSWAPKPVTAGGLSALAEANKDGYALHTTGGDRRFLPGVNLGSTTPGHQPGELDVITAAHYRNWFDAMGLLGVRVVRIYTIHPPDFYTELAAYNNAHPDRPLYLMQGVYLPDNSYIEKQNLYDRTVTEPFNAELRDASAAVSGTLTRAPTPGRASGTWSADVSRWLAGWIIGVEWDPAATAASDRKNSAAPAFHGKYFVSTPQASPTERWLAARMDELATAEAGHGRTEPIAFANWPTTDPLRHAYEPLESEDLVGVDANHVRPTAAWPGGTFASYHAYPYYPDFQRYEYQGKPDPYAAYLTALRQHHTGMPVLVTEFGVPSSIGTAHLGPLRRGQGDHSEHEAMLMDAELLRLIRDQGLSGAFVFAWTDEWFKLTWNTVTHQVPADRRQLWHDPLTNEQYFGVVATDPLGPPDQPTQTLVDDPNGTPARRVTATYDESFIHLRITPADPKLDKLTIGLDVLSEITGDPPPGSTDRRPDTAWTLDLTAQTGQSWIRSELDPLQLDYAVPDSARPKPVNGWRPYQLIVNRALYIPTLKRQMPVELFDVGKLRYGTLDQAAPGADSRSLWVRDGADVIVRIPWALAGFSDPSSRQVLTPKAGLNASVGTPGVTFIFSAQNTDQTGRLLGWDRWQRVYYTERLKPGADELQRAFLATGE